MPVEILAPDNTTGEPIEGLDPSAQEEPSSSAWDKTLGSSQEPSVRSRKAPPHGSMSKRPITRLQKKEELESVLKKKGRLVKNGKVVNERVVAPALIVNVDDEVEEEPGPLFRKSSKKLTVLKSKRGSSVSEKELSKVEGEKSGEKEDEKMVEESCEKVAEESAEKISRKSAEKGKSVRKSVKMKVDANEEPGSSKKTKVGDTQDADKEKLKNQKVL
ncbi:protein pxr1-like [Nicotiana tomentosiformis]|uniref:protein pxr1-like n=1 Tax=Nicotiana tomentosiformis TaxID=4098 RepID=UPI00388C6523